MTADLPDRCFFKGVLPIVFALAGALQAQTIVTLQATTSPGVAETGLTTVYVTGINFPAATITPADVTVTLTPKPPATGQVLKVQAAAVLNLVGTSKRVSFLAPLIPISQPVSYLVTIADSTTGQAFTSGNSANLTINPPAVIQSVIPNSGLPGTTVGVTIQGLYSNFFKGTSVVSAGPGITVQSATVMSSTVMTAQFVIAAGAVPGPRTVTVTTAAEVASLANGFNVIGTPGLLSISPNTGQQGQQGLSVAIAGQYTHFAQGTTTASFGQGITVASLTVNSATSATAVLNINPAAATVASSVTLTTGTEVATLINGFTVTPGTPVLLSAAPNNGQQGQQSLSVAITGQFTHWVQGTTTASFGAGITVASLTVASATSATAVLNIAPTAAVGSQNVILTTGTEVVTLVNGFSISAATPVLSSVAPNSGQQGQQGLPVTITGQYTHFVQGTTTASFGAGITVVSLTIGSATSATAVVNIASSATIGSQNVVLTTGSEVATLVNGFSITAGTPVLTSVAPNSGQQGRQRGCPEFR